MSKLQVLSNIEVPQPLTQNEAARIFNVNNIINDTQSSSTTTYSSAKIDSLIMNVGSVNKFISIIEGDDTETVFTIEHNLGTENVQVQVRDNTSKTNVIVSDTIVDENNILITFASAPITGQDYTVTIIGL